MPSDAAIKTIAAGIAQQEGYGVKSTNRPTRNNNPGDLKSTSFSNPKGIYPVDDENHVVYPTVDAGKAVLDRQVQLALTPGSNSHFNPDMTLNEMGKIYAADPNWGKGVAASIDKGRGIVTGDTKLKDIEAFVNSGTLPPTAPPLPNPAADGPVPNQAQDLPDRQASDFVQLSDQTISDTTYQSLNPDLIVTTELDAVPWFQDTDLLTGNPRIRSFVTPVSFRMLIKEQGGKPLSNSAGQPIEVQLNASVKSYSKTMKHVYNKVNTRTGIHVTLWGQQADIIEAQCTTGVFMNQLGITDFLSTSGVNDEIIGLLNAGFSHTFDDETEEIGVANAAVDQLTTGGPGAFRVAAQDAFVEFLSLFKSNGNIWFRKDNYTGALSQHDQAGASAWSPTTGLSSMQGNSRNNDVMTRGFIAMSLKDSIYLGFFKSVSFTMDANNPFSWNFSFVFQVERTISTLAYPAPV